MAEQQRSADHRSQLAEWYQHHRRYLLSVAYRMTGTFTEAEDIVHDVFLHLQNQDPGVIRDARPYLTKMVVRRSMDVLKSARRKRETYVGPWLPEPDVRPADEEPVSGIMLEETISYALLVVMDRLTPSERAVFLLHDAFGYRYGEIASALGKSEAACRQLMSRVRRKLEPDLPEPVPRPAEIELVERFIQAAQSGRMDNLIQLLREDIVMVTDGGGRAAAASRPILGIERTAAFVLGIASKYQDADVQVVPVRVNGSLGLALREQGVWTNVLSFEWREGRMRRMYSIRNPEKLGSLRAWTDL